MCDSSADHVYIDGTQILCDSSDEETSQLFLLSEPGRQPETQSSSTRWGDENVDPDVAALMAIAVQNIDEMDTSYEISELIAIAASNLANQMHD